jgi:hypothetical protein
VVLPVPVDPSGRRGPTRGAARGPGWRRTSRGYYVPSWVDAELPEQRVAEAVPLLAPNGAVTGWGALIMNCVGFLDGRGPCGRRRLPVTLTQGRHQSRTRHPGVRQRQDPVGQVRVIAGLPVHEPARALLDEMRLADDLVDAVVAADAVLAARLTSREEMGELLSSHAGWQGIAQARRAVELAEGGSKSPPESRLRMLWVLEARLPRPVVNRPVFSRAGRFLGYPDLLDPEAGMVLEYDGADHRMVRRQTSDNHRQEGLDEHGLQVLRVTSLDMRDHDALVRRIHGVRRRCTFLPPERRAWTLTPPPGWRPPPGWDR